MDPETVKLKWSIPLIFEKNALSKSCGVSKIHNAHKSKLYHIKMPADAHDCQSSSLLKYQLLNG